MEFWHTYHVFKEFCKFRERGGETERKLHAGTECCLFLKGNSLRPLKFSMETRSFWKARQPELFTPAEAKPQKGLC
eukprot:1145322-Pelagomonas_calceolata.AAC.1